MLCPNCGKNMSDDTKFCTACGASMSGAQKMPEQQPQAQPVVQPQATQFDAQPAATPAPAPTPTPIPQPAPVFQTSDHAILGTATVAATSQNKTGIKTNNLLVFIALGIAIIALVLTVIGFALPKASSGAAKIVDAGTATITIKAGETDGATKILPNNSPYIVIATSIGGISPYKDVMYNKASGELIMFSSETPTTDTNREVNWIAVTE